MNNALRHKNTTIAGKLSESEWNSIYTHIFNNQAKGDILYASSSEQLERLGITAARLLGVSGGVPVWTNTLPAFTLGGALTLNGQTFDAGAGRALVVTTGETALFLQTTFGGQKHTLHMKHLSGTPLDNDYQRIKFTSYNDNFEEIEYGNFVTKTISVADGLEDAQFQIYLMNAGAWNNALSLSGAGALWLDAGLTVGGTIRASTPIWWHEYLIPPYAADPGASGATWVDPTTNRIGGWQLNASSEHLHIHFHIEDDWDGATDPELHITFEINSAGSTGGDTVDIKVIFYYKALGVATTKTQTVEVATVVNADAQYTQYHAVFTIDYDLGGNLVVADDTFGVTVNLETDTSEVDDITINGFEFKYKTAKVHMEA